VIEPFILFKVAEAWYAAPTSQVVQLESFTGATKVPGTPAHVEGLVQLRGAVIPVINLRARFGLPLAAPTLDSRVIVVDLEGRRVGVLADSAREIRKLETDELRPPPDSIARQSRGLVKLIGAAGDRLVMLIDFDRVVGSEVLNGQLDAPQG